MHGSVVGWTREMVEKYSLKGKILEVGSLNVNGSVREEFGTTEMYVGVDIQAGPGVDLLMNGHNLAFQKGFFDLVICTEVFEHDEEFWVTLKEIERVLKKGGIFLFSTRGNGFPLHEHPGDYWRFMPSAAGKILALAGCEVLETQEDPEAPGIFGLGRRKE